MNNNFYKAWLPISLAVHVVLLCSLSIVPFGVPRIDGNQVLPLTIIDTAQAEPLPARKKEAVKLLPLPEVKPPVEPPVHVSEGPVRHERANTPEIGNQTKNPQIKSGAAKLPGNGKVSTTKGPGVGDTKAPALVTSQIGVGAVPKGDPDGTGDGSGKGLGPSGPSYGPKSKYGNAGGMSKAAGEINLVTDAIFTVQVSVTGSISDVTQTKSTGNDELDRIAARLVRARDYNPAMKNGQVAAATLRVKVKFNSGAYSVEDL